LKGASTCPNPVRNNIIEEREIKKSKKEKVNEIMFATLINKEALQREIYLYYLDTYSLLTPLVFLTFV